MKIKGYEGWKRHPNQEGGAVHRWYELYKPREGIEITASIGDGYFPTEWNVRIGGKVRGEWFDAIESRGSKDILERRTDQENIRGIEMILDRYNLLNKKPKSIRAMVVRKRRMKKHKKGSGWFKEKRRHRMAALKGLHSHGKRRTYRKAGKTHRFSLARDRAIKAKHHRTRGMPTWRGDLKGSRI